MSEQLFDTVLPGRAVMINNSIGPPNPQTMPITKPSQLLSQENHEALAAARSTVDDPSGPADHPAFIRAIFRSLKAHGTVGNKRA